MTKRGLKFRHLCSTSHAFLCSMVFHGWADQKSSGEKLLLLIITIIGSGDKRTEMFRTSRSPVPCPLSHTAGPPSKHTNPQVRKWGLRPLNLCGDVINSSILAFTKESDREPKLSPRPGKHDEEASPGALFLHNNLAESKNRKHK